MAESVREARDRVDAIANEHAQRGTTAGARAIAEELGIPYEELVEAIEETPELSSMLKGANEAPEGAMIGMTASSLAGLVKAMTIAGFFYGVRWEQQRGS